MFFGKKEREETIQSKFDKLNAKYLDLLDEYSCEFCKKYYTGNISKFIERFSDCNGCVHFQEMLDLAYKLYELDEIIERP